MRKICGFLLLTLIFCCWPQVTFADHKAEIENLMKVSSQQAKCLDAVHLNFNSEQEEKVAYRKIYRQLISNIRKAVRLDRETGYQAFTKLHDYIGNEEIIIGFLLCGLLHFDEEYNEKKAELKKERNLEEAQKILWEINACEAIYSQLQ